MQYLRVIISYFLNLKCTAVCSCYTGAAQHSAAYRYSATYNVWLWIFQGYKSGNGVRRTRLDHCYITPLLRTLGIKDTKWRFAITRVHCTCLPLRVFSLLLVFAKISYQYFWLLLVFLKISPQYFWPLLVFPLLRYSLRYRYSVTRFSNTQQRSLSVLNLILSLNRLPSVQPNNILYHFKS